VVTTESDLHFDTTAEKTAGLPHVVFMQVGPDSVRPPVPGRPRAITGLQPVVNIEGLSRLTGVFFLHPTAGGFQA